MQFYAQQAGFIPFERLPEHIKTTIAACTLPGWRHAKQLWWKRHRSERGWVWEPLQVK